MDRKPKTKIAINDRTMTFTMIFRVSMLIAPEL